jgi:hypothetical protein
MITSLTMPRFDSPAFTSANSAINSAAPSAIEASIAKSGFYYDELTTQTWYTKVPKAQQTAVAGYISAFDSVVEKFVGTATSTSKGDAARQTGLGVAGVVGVMGVLAAL